MAHCNVMICQRVTLSGDAEWPKVADAVIEASCYLAVVCGVSLRHIALLFSSLFLIPITKSSIKRWMDDIGSH